MHPWSENLVWGEQQILGKLKERYDFATEREQRACLVLAMTLSVPLEIDLWPEGLYTDIQDVFHVRRLELGIA